MQTKTRLQLAFNWLTLLSLILASCSGPQAQATPTSVPPTLTSQQQTAPPAIIETDPPLDSVIGYLSPITFYFNQPMNPSTVESAFSGLPTATPVSRVISFRIFGFAWVSGNTAFTLFSRMIFTASATHFGE